MAPSIRAAQPADLPRLRDVYRRSSLSNAGDRPHLLAHPEALQLAEAPVHEGRTIVATREGTVVGFATADERDGALELVDLFVDPDETRRGIGSSLVRAVRERATSVGATRVEVTGNPHALAFYERAGFVVVGDAETEFGPALRLHLTV